MTDYTASPGTDLVATRCACCSRELLDAVSVETGMGEWCRARHGYKAADVAPAWEAVRSAVAPHVVALAMPAGWDEDARRAANVLVHRIASEHDGERALACTNALHALGFHKLAKRVAVRLAKIEVWEEEQDIVVRAPFSEDLMRVPGRRWIEAEKVTRFTVRRSFDGMRRMVLDALARSFPGAAVLGMDGLFVLPREE